MATLSVFYLFFSIKECTTSANENRAPPYPPIGCDLPVASQQLLMVVLSTLTSVGFLGNKIGQLECLRLRWKERISLKVERTRVLTELAHGGRLESVIPGSPAAAPQTAAQPDSAPAPAGAAGAAVGSPSANDFILNRNTPAAAAPNLGQVPHAPGTASAASQQAAAPPEVRGVCPGCARNVLSNDEGRHREDDIYYHSECVKGWCGRCGKIVHSNGARTWVDGEYWHVGCYTAEEN